MGFGLEFQKSKSRFAICILEILCASIFRQNGQLWIFWPKFAQNWILGSEFQKYLDPKIKSCPFRLKIGTHGILEVLIGNPDLDFWNSNPKIHFWANLGPEIPSCPFCLKIGTHSISKMLIPNPVIDFWNSVPKICFWEYIGPENSKLFVLSENWYTWNLEDADSYWNISFLNFKSEFPFWGNFYANCMPTLVLWFSNFKVLFQQTWVKKFKVFCFA